MERDCRRESFFFFFFFFFFFWGAFFFFLKKKTLFRPPHKGTWDRGEMVLVRGRKALFSGPQWEIGTGEESHRD